MSKKDTVLQGITTIGERGQIVIPQSIRRAMKLKAGDTMVVLGQDHKIVVFPAKQLERFYKKMMGRVKKMQKDLEQ